MKHLLAKNLRRGSASCPGAPPAALTSAGRRKIVSAIIKTRALAQEAIRSRLDQDELVQLKLRLQRNQLLAAELMERITAQSGVTEETIHAYFEALQLDFQVVKARHILVSFAGSLIRTRSGDREVSEAEALNSATLIRQESLNGADFAEVAKRTSDDSASYSIGGDLGTIARGQMPPELDRALFVEGGTSLSLPIKTKYGYHIVQMLERSTLPFEAVREKIEDTLRRQRVSNRIDELISRLHVELDGAYFSELPEPSQECRSCASSSN